MKSTIWTLALCGAVLSTQFSGHASAAQSAPAALSTSNGLNIVAYLGTDNYVHTLVTDNLSWWSTATFGYPYAAGDPSAFRRSDYNVNSIVWRDSNNHILELTIPGGGVTDLFSGTNATPAKGNPSGFVDVNNGNNIAYRGLDNQLYMFSRVLGSTSWLGGSAPFASSLAGNPFGYVHSDGTPAIVYRGLDNHVHEVAPTVTPRGKYWLPMDLSSTANAVAAAGDPVAYRRSDNVNSVVYHGIDNHIYELYLPFTGGSGWQVRYLFAGLPAVAAAGDPAVYVRSDNVNSVVYRGIDNHIHELTLPLNGAAWATGDLSSGTLAPAAAGEPAGYRRTDATNSVVYRAYNNHLYELYLASGSGWKVRDLFGSTSSSGAAAAR